MRRSKSFALIGGALTLALLGTLGGASAAENLGSGGFTVGTVDSNGFKSEAGGSGVVPVVAPPAASAMSFNYELQVFIPGTLNQVSGIPFTVNAKGTNTAGDSIFNEAVRTTNGGGSGSGAPIRVYPTPNNNTLASGVEGRAPVLESITVNYKHPSNPQHFTLSAIAAPTVSTSADGKTKTYNFGTYTFDVGNTEWVEIPPVPPADTPETFKFTIDMAAPGCVTPLLYLNSASAASLVSPSGATTAIAAGRPDRANPVNQTGEWTVKGKFSTVNFGGYEDDATSATCYTAVTYWSEDAGTTNLDYSFRRASNLASIVQPPSTVTSLNYTFSEAAGFNANITRWDTSKITSMEGTFSGARSFAKSLQLWDVSNVKNMASMFSGATSFAGPVTGWNTSKVTSMRGMFAGATSFNGYVLHFNTANVVDMSAMFAGAKAFDQPVNGWDVSKVQTMQSMFSGATIFNRTMSTWKTGNVLNFNQMFTQAASFNQSLNTWDVSKATDFGFMFQNAKVFNQPLNSWYPISARNMDHMFNFSPAFNQNLSSWNMPNLDTSAPQFKGNWALGSPLGNNPAYLPPQIR